MTHRDVDYRIEDVQESFSFSHRSLGPEHFEMDITPMIDITFLLLIFFLVASRLSDEAHVELPAARHGTAVSSDTSVIVTLAKGRDDNAVIYKGDGADPTFRLSSTALEDQHQELHRYIENGLNSTNKQQLLIKAEQGVRHRDVARVARAAGDATARVMYIAVAEQRQ